MTGSAPSSATFIRLLPGPQVGGLDPLSALDAEERSPHASRPWVLTNMIMSLDGAVSIDARSAGLGGPADQQMLAALRSLADAIIVGASTATAEQYRRPVGSPATRLRRLRRGQTEAPRLAIVSGSLSLPLDLPALLPPPLGRGSRPSEERVLLFTGSAAPAARIEELSRVAEIVHVETPQVGPAEVLAELWSRRCRIILLEGGPTLNGEFAAAGLIDEWNLTLSPLLIGGDAGRAIRGPLVTDPEHLRLDRLWLSEGLVFGRWVRRNR